MRIAINGAGIAGPTLAYWLRKSAHDALLIDEAPQLRSGGFPVEVFGRATNGRFTSLRRSDLAATIHAALDGRVETVSGASVARITPERDRLQISFDQAAPRQFDLVIGAD